MIPHTIEVSKAIHAAYEEQKEAAVITATEEEDDFVTYLYQNFCDQSHTSSITKLEAITAASVPTTSNSNNDNRINTHQTMMTTTTNDIIVPQHLSNMRDNTSCVNNNHLPSTIDTTTVVNCVNNNNTCHDDHDYYHNASGTCSLGTMNTLTIVHGGDDEGTLLTLDHDDDLHHDIIFNDDRNVNTLMTSTISNTTKRTTRKKNDNVVGQDNVKQHSDPSTTTGKKKRRTEKDPKRQWKKQAGKPKHPLTSYNMFFYIYRQRYFAQQQQTNQDRREDIVDTISNKITELDLLYYFGPDEFGTSGLYYQSSSSSKTKEKLFVKGSEPQTAKEKWSVKGSEPQTANKSFANLGKCVSLAWKNIDSISKALLQRRAQQYQKLYHLQIQEWKERMQFQQQQPDFMKMVNNTKPVLVTPPINRLRPKSLCSNAVTSLKTHNTTEMDQSALQHDIGNLTAISSLTAPKRKRVPVNELQGTDVIVHAKKRKYTKQRSTNATACSSTLELKSITQTTLNDNSNQSKVDNGRLRHVTPEPWIENHCCNQSSNNYGQTKIDTTTIKTDTTDHEILTNRSDYTNNHRFGFFFQPQRFLPSQSKLASHNIDGPSTSAAANPGTSCIARQHPQQQSRPQQNIWRRLEEQIQTSVEVNPQQQFVPILPLNRGPYHIGDIPTCIDHDSHRQLQTNMNIRPQSQSQHENNPERIASIIEALYPSPRIMNFCSGPNHHLTARNESYCANISNDAIRENNRSISSPTQFKSPETWTPMMYNFEQRLVQRNYPHSADETIISSQQTLSKNEIEGSPPGPVAAKPQWSNHNQYNNASQYSHRDGTHSMSSSSSTGNRVEFSPIRMRLHNEILYAQRMLDQLDQQKSHMQNTLTQNPSQVIASVSTRSPPRGTYSVSLSSNQSCEYSPTRMRLYNEILYAQTILDQLDRSKSRQQS